MTAILLQHDGFDGRFLPSEEAINGLIEQAVAFAGPRRDAVELWRARQDGLNVPLAVKAMGAVLRQDALEPLGQGRQDSDFAAAGGLFQMRQLEYVYREVLEEKRPALNALSLFPIDTQVPLGARTHTVRRYTQTGEAKIFRGSNVDIPGADMGAKEESFPVRYIVTSIKANVFELASANFAQVGLIAGKTRSAVRAYDSLVNRLAWYGSPNDGLYGILNYPWLDKYVEATAFDGTADPDDVQLALSRIANYPANNSLMTFMPDTMAVSHRVYAYLFETRIGTTTDTTIGQFFLKNNPYIKRIVPVWELQGVGPGGTDGILAFKASPDSVALVMPAGLTPLPVQFQGFEQVTPMFGAWGGAVMRDVGNNVLAWVTPPAI